jgi:arylsulfatase A-like enzyme
MFRFQKSLFLLLFFILFSSLKIEVGKLIAREKSSPNIVLIMADDQGWGDISSHGNPHIKTPQLDLLASQGTRLNRFFVSPVCAPTRASLLTGRYHLRTGVHGVTRGYENMRAEEVTLAEILSSHGYVTGAFGKWHNGRHYPNHPNGQGFDQFFGFCGGHWNTYFNTTLENNGKSVSTEGYIIDVITNAAMDFIKKNQEKPFFCYVPLNTPHSPWTVPDKYWDKYESASIDKKARCAYAMVDNIDENVGRILKQLDRLDLSKNTIVIYLSDNGPNSDRYNGNMKGRKGSIHEGGVRVPFFIRYPGKIKAGNENNSIAAHIDILPTLLDLCGLQVPGNLQIDGTSFVSLLNGKQQQLPDRKLFQHWANRGAVRTEKWRATFEKKRWALYDMINDPNQKMNIATDHSETLKRLSFAYEEWYKDVTQKGFDPMPIPIGYSQAPNVSLPAHEAFLFPQQGKGINYMGVKPRGFANAWIDRWSSKNSYPYWPVDLIQPGEYQVFIKYNCRKNNENIKFNLTNDKDFLQFSLKEAFYSEPFFEEKRMDPSEHYGEKKWKTTYVGNISLTRKISELKLKITEMPGDEAIELKSIQLRKIQK